MKINQKMLHYIEQAIGKRLNRTTPGDRYSEFRKDVKQGLMDLELFQSPDLLCALELACADLGSHKKATQEKLDQAVNACCDAYNYMTGSRSEGDLLSTLNDAIDAAS